MRQGTAKCKSKSEVSGSGAKARQQKGTGRARGGSKRPPHWRGGGVAHGPKGNRDWSFKLNKKVIGRINRVVHILNLWPLMMNQNQIPQIYIFPQNSNQLHP